MVSELTYPFPDLPEPGKTLEVADNIHWARMPLPFDLDHINLWLVDDGDSWTIVDTGLKHKEIKALWREIFDNGLAGRPVRRMIITHMHPDHVGLAGWIQEKLGPELWMSRAEWLFARLLSSEMRDEPPELVMEFHRCLGMPDDQLEILRAMGFGHFARGVTTPPISYKRLREGNEITLGGGSFRVKIGEGHSPEHVCLISEDKKIMFAGDQILPRISPIIGVYPGEPEANPLADFIASLEGFSDLPDDMLALPAHGLPFYGLNARIGQLIEHHRERCDILIANCAEPVTVYECLPLLFRRPLTGQNVFMAATEALAHFNLLIAEGRMVCETRADGVFLYRTTQEADAAA